MKRIVLISCVNKKTAEPAKAKDLYISPLFRFSWQYAMKLEHDLIFILSAKHGLLDPERIIKPYNETLSNYSSKVRKVWGGEVAEQLGQKADLRHDYFIFLAGSIYQKALVPFLGADNYENPLDKLPIGGRLHFLKEQLQS